MSDTPTPPVPHSERQVNLSLTEAEANSLASLLDIALKAGGIRVMTQVAHFMNKISQAVESGLIIASASDLPKPPSRG